MFASKHGPSPGGVCHTRGIIGYYYLNTFLFQLRWSAETLTHAGAT